MPAASRRGFCRSSLTLTVFSVPLLPKGHDPALDLVEPELAAELHRLAGLEPRDDLGLRLEQRPHLLTGRDGVPVEDAAGRLLDSLDQPGQDHADPLNQPLGRWLCPALEDLQHAPGLMAGPLGRVGQPAVRRLQGIAGRGPLAAGEAVQPPGPPADGAHPAAKSLRPQRGGRVPQHGSRPLQQPREDPHAVRNRTGSRSNNLTSLNQPGFAT